MRSRVKAWSAGSNSGITGHRGAALLGALALAIAALLGAASALADAPPAVTIAAPTAVTATSAHVSGTVDPEGGPSETFWLFEETLDPSGEWHPLSAPHSASSGSGPVDVAEDLENLQPETTFFVRLVATNEGGVNRSETEAPYPSFETEAATATPAKPTAATIPAFALQGGTSALLGGKVNPENSPTTYWVEYGGDENYGHSAPAGHDAAAGSGGEAVFVTKEISDLAPETTYHFRLVAENAIGKTPGPDLTFESAPSGPAAGQSCPNESFRVGAAARLPDCRAYEQVSPIAKNNGDVCTNCSTPVSTGNGDALTFTSTVSFPGAPVASFPTSYIARRSGSGWSTSAISPRLNSGPYNFVQGPEIQAFSEGLERSVVMAGETPFSAGAPQGVNNLYLHDESTGAYQLLTPTGPASPNPFYRPQVAGTSSDGRDVFFESELALLPGATEGVANVYEWADGTLRLASILPGPNEEPITDGAVAGAAAATAGGIPAGAKETSSSFPPISSDGSRVIFTDVGDGQIYLREDGSRTIDVSASQRSPVEPMARAIFRTATPNGSKVFFTSPARLTEDATAATFGFENLYEYDVQSGELADLSIDHDPRDKFGADVEGVVGLSEDGEYVYFAAGGHLAPGHEEGGAPVSSVSGGIYLWHDHTTTFVTSTRDSGNSTNSGQSRLRSMTVTPDGQQLIFLTRDQITAYDNHGFTEVYRYSVGSGPPVCISCDPSGRAPTSEARLSRGAGTAGSNHLTRNLVEDGSKVFFESADALVPGDVNGQYDVYEWSEGRPQLMSTGESGSESRFMDASHDGSDVFFTTRQRLVGQDNDDLVDAYDAREDGGLAAQTVQPAPAPCQGEACKGPAQPAPAAAAPGSSSFAGPGNAKSHKAQHKKHKKKHQKKKPKHQDAKHQKPHEKGAKRAAHNNRRNGR